ncbi:ADP-ribose pyrophosphatase YjhB, NUDIX family [Amycolatopsis marina]|uniref:ADP-ribose pyrophosphatase YjhB, NUDIX family n=1 Tax=Amycolatopsis marina TaxID=490629 RepID=A0A1I0WU77_9PSEU|nr:NUDIX hydrolase [Amycolatopsis marina]SFA92161.1 ADP-ribose pyrophosphatase YjhB, NUDIX family [Amycolatopsis marina]
MNYIAELRRLVGSRPLILPGTSVVLVDDAGRILLVRRTDTGDWGLPGGFMDPGESFEDTGRREVREEIGLEIDKLELLGVFSGPEYYYRYPHGDEVFNVTVAYTARPSTGEIEPDHTEVGEVRFFEPTELPADILAPEKPIVERYLGLVTHRPTPQRSG